MKHAIQNPTSQSSQKYRVSFRILLLFGSLLEQHIPQSPDGCFFLKASISFRKWSFVKCVGLSSELRRPHFRVSDIFPEETLLAPIETPSKLLFHLPFRKQRMNLISFDLKDEKIFFYNFVPLFLSIE